MAEVNPELNWWELLNAKHFRELRLFMVYNRPVKCWLVHGISSMYFGLPDSLSSPPFCSPPGAMKSRVYQAPGRLQ